MNHKYTPFVTGLAWMLIGSVAVVGAGSRVPVWTGNTGAEAASLPAAAPAVPVPETSSDVTSEREIVPNALNLVYEFPEGAETEDVLESEMGRIYRELEILDQDWLDNIYNLSGITPKQMAERLGLPAEAVTGSYNPKDENQTADDPSTWQIGSWRRINISVLNGDGSAADSYSNVKEILSMANVYTFYHDYQDTGLFLEYARELWNASHSYQVSISGVYYCDGCLDQSESEEMAEDIAEIQEEESQPPESGSSGEETSSADLSPSLRDSSASGPGVQQRAAIEESIARLSETETPEEPSVQTDTSSQTDGSQTSTSSQADSSSQTDDSFQTDSSSLADITVSDPGIGEKDSAETGQETLPAEGSAAPENLIPETSAPAGSASVSSEPEQSSSYQETPEALETSEGHATPSQLQGPGDYVQMLVDAARDSDAGQETSGQAQAESIPGSRADSSSEPAVCPGHVDLNITVHIIGTEESSCSLYDLDERGGTVTDSWPGWTEEMKAFVADLKNQDWYENYGLSISDISLQAPMSPEEVDAYMASLPEDLSQERRELIRFALESVGRVPYYWGGKASSPGYAGNRFGTLISSDYKGRIRKGLDCSGWVSWVYWSATGERLPAEGTSGLIQCGTAIARSQLQPGDIIVRTGSNAHVVMFLGWGSNGKLLCIHESSGSANNVTISELDANWKYYRKLIE